MYYVHRQHGWLAFVAYLGGYRGIVGGGDQARL